MNRRTVVALAGIAAVLVVLLLVLESFDGGGRDEDRRLLPDFAGVANDLEAVRITGADDPAGTTLRKDGDGWVVAERDGYPADTAKLRQLVIALAEAGIVEEKTANPEYYDRLGLGAPGEDGEGGEGDEESEDGEDGTGVQVVAEAGGSDTTVIFGDTAQGDNRYARTPASPQTYLVDRNPAIPVVPGEWLEAELADIAAGDMRRVRIEHADGESIQLEKADPAAVNFEVLNVPEGRELSYASVGDGIAGALSTLELEDVRRATDAMATTTTVYETFDGLVVTVEAIEVPLPGADDAPDAPVAPEAPDAPAPEDEEVTGEEADASEADAEPTTETWLRFTASVAEGTTAPVESSDDAAPAATDTSTSDDASTDAAAATEAVTSDADTAAPAEAEAPSAEAGGTDNAAGDDATPQADAATDADTGEAAEAAPATESPRERADALNARWSGWEYRVPDYKQELITRRWDDLLE
ncbi:MAG TPA: DUF4340 domain-containing protein [Woeseiaceae bacterium]|nr:DUF4340 domain-containing protein [Woeseiaceae bacterium]